MTRQPRLFANSRTSASDISRRTRSSAGWMTTYSELFDSLSPIFAARAGKSSCIFFHSNEYLRDPILAPFPSAAVAAVAWVCDLIWDRARERPCGRAKVRVRLVSPCQCWWSSRSIYQLARWAQAPPPQFHFTGAVVFHG